MPTNLLVLLSATLALVLDALPRLGDAAKLLDELVLSEDGAERGVPGLDLFAGGLRHGKNVWEGEEGENAAVGERVEVVVRRLLALEIRTPSATKEERRAEGPCGRRCAATTCSLEHHLSLTRP